jgi:PTS system mannitol-specific IIA component
MKTMDDRMLSEATVRVGAAFADKDEAIRACGELLRAAGHVGPEYIEKMVERDNLSTTYVGSGVAVPHGTKAGIAFVKSTGLAVVQVPAGVDFGKGNIAYLLVAIAAKGDEHIDILTEIASICADDERLEGLLKAGTARDLLALIGGAGA